MTTATIPIKRALISVYNKDGLDVLAQQLHQLGVEIISTGGTAKYIEQQGIPVVHLADYTGSPEILGGRVKTLHPKVHGGLLALRGDARHTKDRQALDIGLIDLVVVNLYPFEETIRQPGVALAEAVEQIDIGGPSMLRSASKNFRHVAVVSSPDQYPRVLDELVQTSGSVSQETTAALAVEAFARTSAYDAEIAKYLGGQEASTSSNLPKQLSLQYTKIQDLRYGENPHQAAALYESTTPVVGSLVTAKQLHGKQLSYNNMLDMDAAWRIVQDLKDPAAAVIKHNTPCGVASADDLVRAYRDAYASDPVSAYGGIVAFNRRVDPSTAELLSETRFVECVVAPNFSKEALRLLTKKKNIRLVAVGTTRRTVQHQVTPITGGALVQQMDVRPTPAQDVAKAKIVTKRRPGAKQLKALEFAWTVAKHAKSNAIVLVNGTATVGIGAGNTSRVGAAEEALKKAGDRAKGACLASDGFFPMADGIQVAGKHGVRAVIQPGGSIRDQEVIDAANKLGMSMLCTGVRHFKH